MLDTVVVKVLKLNVDVDRVGGGHSWLVLLQHPDVVNNFLYGLDLIDIVLKSRSEVISLSLGQALDLFQAEVMHKVRIIVGLASGWLEDVLCSLPVTVDVFIF
jgi:hypothetical protein